METIRSIKKVFGILFFFIVCFCMTTPVAAKDASKDFEPVQADVRLPQIKVYLETEDGELLEKENISASLKNYKADCTVDSVEKYKDAEGYIKYYILFDISTSVKDAQFRSMKQSVIKLSENIREGDQIQVVTFGKNVKTILDGTETKAELKKTINNLKQEKKTHLYQGLSGLADNIDQDKKAFVKDETQCRQFAFILTDWQEIKEAGGTHSREEALAAFQKTGVPLYGFCLDTASVKLQDDMGEFVRETGGDFAYYVLDQSADKDVLVKTHKNRLNDCCVTLKLNSSETSAQAASLKITVDGTEKTMDPLYLNYGEDDVTAPEITEVTEDDDKKDTLILTFSESVEEADNKNNYTVTRNKKDTCPVAEATYTEKDGKYQVKLVFNQNLSKGSYTIETSNITDRSDQHNSVQEAWEGELNGQGTLQMILALLGKFWPVLVFVIIVLVLAVIYFTIKRNKGLLLVDNKIVMGDNVNEKHHFEQDQSSMKYITIDVEGVTNDSKTINLQVMSSAIVGRASICDVYFDDLNMSKQHFAIEVEQGRVFITDLESKNGTFVNGVRIRQKTEISTPTMLQAGNVSMMMRW